MFPVTIKVHEEVARKVKKKEEIYSFLDVYIRAIRKLVYVAVINPNRDELH